MLPGMKGFEYRKTRKNESVDPAGEEKSLGFG